MAKNPELIAHQEWLGYVQPVGLVVSTPALLAAQAYINKNIIPEHQRFLECVEPIPINGCGGRNLGDNTALAVTDFRRFLLDVLDWQPQDLVGDAGPHGEGLESLEVVLPEYGETLRPTYAVKEIEPDSAADNPWLMLIQTVPNGADLDTALDTNDHKWQASPHAHFERLLRETKVPIGLLFNGTHFRLVYAPRGETSGYLTFPVDAMAQVDGRPIFAGLHLLLSAERLFTLPRKQRLPYLLSESRKYQNLVSTQLSEQVLHSLYELLRGFQAADDVSHGELLRQVLKEDPNHVYQGLLNVLLRLVFVLYAEDRGLMPGDSVYTNFYSVNGLFERLRADASRFPDTMDQRYGAWAQLLSLFRLIHDGARYSSGSHGATFELPPRHGHLFNPDRYPFLEGRAWQSTRQISETIQPPMVSDGIVFRVLQNLLVLDGERLSYRTLDVEQIGSVYETVMGFTLEVAQGRSIAIKPTKPHGAPLTINLDELLSVKPGNRAKWVKEQTDQAITGESLRALQDAATPEDLVAALGKKVSPTTPRIVPPGAMILQPSDERRRSGSHYTPRSLTEPIVRTTLRPVLEKLGDRPTPEQILDLKVCDPAMGSGAFLVEADRQLADELVKAWHNHHCVPTIPPDEDEVLFARRLVAQRSLYGVDKNPMAVDLSKLSLWLATLAKDHAFTFVDHALRCGDSLVGLSRQQIASFNWGQSPQLPSVSQFLTDRIKNATKARREIINADEFVLPAVKTQKLKLADESLNPVRMAGNACIAAFFSETKDAKRGEARGILARDFSQWIEKLDAEALKRILAAIDTLIHTQGLTPFHWEIEFHEVFDRDNPGFDAFVGNPPFAGHVTIIETSGTNYTEFLRSVFPETGGKCDLVAFFFRRAFQLVRTRASFGLIATNTIRQGDTRFSGLRYICNNGGAIFAATKRLRWPGQAAVVVSVIHILRGPLSFTPNLDGCPVKEINAYLFHRGTNDNPYHLSANASKGFEGSVLRGMGFTFDDTDTKGVATSIAEMNRLLTSNPRNSERIFPYIGGEEINNSPSHAHHRFVINFGEMSSSEAQQWPELFEIVRTRVLSERVSSTAKSSSGRITERFWQFGHTAKSLYDAISNLPRVLAISEVSACHGLAFLSSRVVFSHTVKVFAFDSNSAFSALQSRPHEIWARFFGSSMKDDLRYTPTDCFETFPFPVDFENNPALESVGKEYYEFRAALMVRNNEGLTKTYNRFHDPDEQSPDILRLRELHAAMDRAVLDAYGWTDLQPTCEFLLDYEEEEDEAPARGRGRKKPWRYRWPDDFRDEVLARLLELNRQYAEEERLSGTAAEKRRKRGSTTKGTKDTKKKEKKDEQEDLF